MATYSNAAATSIVLSSTKDIRAAGSTSLFTVAANEEYELIKSFVIAQDGTITVSLYGIYDDDIIDHDVPDSGGEKGFYERIDLTTTGASGVPDSGDYHVYNFTTHDGDIIGGASGTGKTNSIVAESEVSDHVGTLWNTDALDHKPIKFYQGAEIKIFYGASNFVSPEEAQVHLWFRKTVHNG